MDSIKEIQNAVWVIWRQFLADRDVKKYTSNAAELTRKYKDGSIEKTFCQNLLFAYIPLVNDMKAKEKLSAVSVGAMAN